MKNEKTEAQRSEIKTHLTAILEHAESINKLMDKLPKKKGLVHRSLKHRSGEFVLQNNIGLLAHCKNAQGQEFEIRINRTV